MSLILCIETATQVCSVALVKDATAIIIKEAPAKNAHAALITVFIRDLMAENKLGFSDLDAIAISKGPGSYTGLRIGVSTAKGLCYAQDIPLLAVPTLKILVCGILSNYKSSVYENIMFCPMIDARRMEVYSAVYNARLEEVRDIKAEIVETTTYDEYLETGKVIFLGDGSVKCSGIIKHPNAIFSDHLYPSASHMATLADAAFKQKQFEDTAYFEPYYLKDFIPGMPKVKGLF